MSFLSKYFGHKPQPSRSAGSDLRAKCDEVLNSEPLKWAKPYLNEMSRLGEETRKSESSKQREKRILVAQQARERRRTPLFEIMAVAEDERTESENQWVKQYFEGKGNVGA